MMTQKPIKPSALPRLVLFPDDPDFVPENIPQLIDELTAFGLLGKPWRDQRYLTGTRFMQEIVFVGCSPFLRVDPQEDLDFCHIEIPEPTETPAFHAGAYSGTARCPSCKSPLPQSSADKLFCPACQQAFPAERCLWRPGRTVRSRVVINIWGIQKGDAQPTEGLMQLLEQTTGAAWKLAFL